MKSQSQAVVGSSGVNSYCALQRAPVTCENEFYTLPAYTIWIVSKLSVSIIISVSNMLNDIQISTMTTLLSQRACG